MTPMFCVVTGKSAISLNTGTLIVTVTVKEGFILVPNELQNSARFFSASGCRATMVKGGAWPTSVPCKKLAGIKG